MPHSSYIIYIACPYSHPDKEVRDYRVRKATEAAATYVKAGQIVYSPLNHTHGIASFIDDDRLTQDFNFWVMYFDRAFMTVCSELVVVMASGWTKSRGVRYEIQYFKSRGLPITYLEPMGDV